MHCASHFGKSWCFDFQPTVCCYGVWRGKNRISSHEIFLDFLNLYSVFSGLSGWQSQHRGIMGRRKARKGGMDKILFYVLLYSSCFVSLFAWNSVWILDYNFIFFCCLWFFNSLQQQQHQEQPLICLEQNKRILNIIHTRQGIKFTLSNS